MAKKQSDISEYQKLFKEAAEIASVVPESMQGAAFSEALEILLNEKSLKPKVKTKTKTQKQKNIVSTKIKTPKYGRPGPKTMLLALLSEGFFNTGKTIGEINSYLESQKGYAYTTSELSPPLIRLVREEIITRVKNDQNQYEYSAPNS